MNVARERQQLLLVEHLDALLAHGLRRLFEIKALRHGHVEHIILPARAPRHQRLKDLRGVEAHAFRNRHAVHRHALLVRIAVRGISDLLLLEHTHHICLFFLILCHRPLLP